MYLLLSVGIPRGRARARRSCQKKPSANLEERRFSAADGRVVPHVHEAAELLVLHEARRLERGPLEDVCVPDEARSAASFVGSKNHTSYFEPQAGAAAFASTYPGSLGNFRRWHLKRCV